MQTETFGIFDQVAVKGETGAWTIIGIGDNEPRYKVERDQDSATVRYVSAETLTLVKEHMPPNDDSSVYPDGGTFGLK
jgi:hypothetical protein